MNEGRNIVGAQHAAPLPCGLLAALLIAALSSCAATQSISATSTPLAVVEQYVSVLNRRDLLMLTAYVAPDVTWFSVVNGERILEVSGRQELAQTLTRYFAQNAQTHWTIEQATLVDQTVAVRERSQWRNTESSSERLSLAVYEVRDGRIVRISHFLDASD